MNKTLRRVLCAASAVVLGVTGLSGCGGDAAEDDSKGRVYYLNRKAEELDTWVKLGKQFEEETGIPVQVQGGADYDAALRSQLPKKNAPTIFTIDGPGMLESYKEYEADLSDAAVYTELKDNYKVNALTNDEGDPVAVPFAVESYGIIYNKALLDKYFKSSWSTVKSIDELNNFDALKTVADEIQDHKDEIGVKGAFSSAGLESSGTFRYYFHMPAIPLFYELQDRELPLTEVAKDIKGTYIKENLKQLYDLYLTDSTVDPKTLPGRTLDESLAEFATGQAVFLQNGVWCWNQIKDQSVAAEDIGVLPIYIGVEGEEDQGLTQVMSNYWCINSNVSEADQEASKQFLEWLITDETAKKTITEDMGLVTPFATFGEEYKVDNPLVQANVEAQAAGKFDTSTVFTPSHAWENDLVTALINYTQGTGDWDDVVSVFTTDWAEEYKLNYEKD
ncbi:carbohydrate ABC transporter substrate-binding protein [Bifidobacterium pullorum subsp. saeculare]|uniref:ABC transporter substrate-binding protein n=1 Tax=Bifidobacterium pullorum TaxID=78448 RepID=UPI0019599256|nr:ABC transporter substrate-binding protein [Bifidobacterium pullorum]MBM6695783.1 carbohydrate ABC transporter substrate-binding protein [Bifidobacterium pullorum subsp. saeculare]